MSVTVNGKPYEPEGAETVERLLVRLGFQARYALVERNRVPVSREEYAKFDPLPDTFDKMDSSKDGNVDVEEFKYYVLSNQPRALVSRKGMAPK